MALCAEPGAIRAQIFVANSNTGTIGKYTTAGVPVNPDLITGLSDPADIAVSGGNLFVTNQDTGSIGEYTTSGAPVNPRTDHGVEFSVRHRGVWRKFVCLK
jgi:hypothetical protein